MMRFGSLFSGADGFSVAASLLGWDIVFHCENNPFCQRILKYHYPKSILYEM